MLNIRGGFASLLAYFQANPGVVSLLVGQALLVLAHFGLHLTAEQLYEASAVALPIVLAYFKGAEHVNKAAAKAQGSAEAIEAINLAKLKAKAAEANK